MNLDFSDCKAKEDVEKVFKKHKEDFEIVKSFKEKVEELKNEK